MICKKCGEQIPKGNKFCESCGAVVTWVETEEKSGNGNRNLVQIALLAGIALVLLTLGFVLGNAFSKKAAEPASTPTPSLTPDAQTVIVQPPTPSPTPIPVPDAVKVFFFEDEKEEFTEKVGESVKLRAVAYPVDLFPNGPFTWSVSDESVIKLTVSDDTRECEVLCLRHHPGGITLTVSCNGVEKKVIVYTRP